MKFQRNEVKVVKVKISAKSLQSVLNKCVGRTKRKIKTIVGSPFCMNFARLQDWKVENVFVKTVVLLEQGALNEGESMKEYPLLSYF